MRHLLLHNEKGETLIEVLASILIAALSVALLFTCVMASSEMGKTAQKNDEAHYDALTEADAQVTPDPSDPVSTVPVGTVMITRTDSSPEVTASPVPSIEIYGDEGMFSYKRK